MGSVRSLSVTIAFPKSVIGFVCGMHHAWNEMFEPFPQSFKCLTCSFFLAEKRLSVSPMKLEGQGVRQGNAFSILAFSVINIDWKPEAPRLLKIS